MTPEKLQTWIYKPCPGGVTLSLVHDQFGNMAGLVVSSWSRDEVMSAKETNVSQAETILEDAQLHCDSVNEACKFQITWFGATGQPLRTLIHRCAPSEPTTNAYAQHADAISPNAMIAQFLGHIHAQQKLINGNSETMVRNMSAVCTAYERAMAMQAQMNAQLCDMLKSQRRELANVETTTPELREYTQAKTAAFMKIAEAVPDIIKFGISAIVPEPSDDKSASPSNGAAAAA